MSGALAHVGCDVGSSQHVAANMASRPCWLVAKSMSGLLAMLGRR